MKKNLHVLRKIILGSGLAFTFVIAMWWSVSAQASDKKHEAHRPVHMNLITTLAQAQALEPGDSIAVVCTMCKNVVIHQVTEDNTHVEMMMTIGHKFTCPDCEGGVEVVGTGEGEGNNENVTYVCGKCGDNAMFVCATAPGSGGEAETE